MEKLHNIPIIDANNLLLGFGGWYRVGDRFYFFARIEDDSPQQTFRVEVVHFPMSNVKAHFCLEFKATLVDRNLEISIFQIEDSYAQKAISEQYAPNNLFEVGQLWQDCGC